MAKTNSITYRLHSFIYGGAKCGHEGLEKRKFALPVYDDKTGKVARHNIYSASMLIRHANDGRKYLYDILAIKKETSSPLE